MEWEERRDKISEEFEKHNEEPSEEEQLSELADTLEQLGWDTQAQELRQKIDTGDTDYEEQVSEFHAKLDQWDVSEFSDERRLLIVRNLWGMLLNGGEYAKEKAKEKLLDLGFGVGDSDTLDRQRIRNFVTQ